MVFRRSIGHVAVILMVLASAALLASVASAAVPALKESLYECRPITAANELDPPEPLWKVNDEPEPPVRMLRQDALAKEPCPAGKIAYPTVIQALHGGPPVIKNGQVRSSAVLASGESARAATGPSYQPEGSNSSVGVIPPESEAEQEGYGYVSMSWDKPSVGGSVKIAVAQPAVDELKGTHSIAQLSFSRWTEPIQTVELGWTVDPKTFGERRPHLFTYVNKDHYVTNGQPGGDCYDCEFVPLAGAELSVGQVLEPAENPIEFGVKFESGNWWVYVYNQWIGYLKGSFWNNEFTESQRHSYYGEIFSEDLLDHGDAMGNGLFGESEGSIKMARPEHFPSVNSAATETLAEAEKPIAVSRPEMYTYGRIGVNEDEWHFGGPGGGPIHLESLYAYGLCINVENSSLTPGALIRNDACAVNHPSQEWLRVVDPGGPVQLIDKNSRLCLWAPELEGRLKQEECRTPSEAGREKFSFVPVQNGGIKWHIVNKANAKCVYTPEGAKKIYPAQQACGPATNTGQLWELY